MRLTGRSINRATILDAVDTYEIIEEYPEDKYFPSYLIRAEHERDIIHVLIATDAENDNIRIVTAYKPTLDKWEEDLRTRRKS